MSMMEAAQSLTLRVGRSQLVLTDAGIRVQTAGDFGGQASAFSFSGPGGTVISLPGMPASQARTDEKFHLRFPNGIAMGNVNAAVKSASGEVLWQGRTDDEGATGLALKDLPEAIHVEFLPD